MQRSVVLPLRRMGRLSRRAVPGEVVQDLALGRLVVLCTALPRLARRLCRVHHQQKRFSANLQRFVAHCAPGLSQMP